MDLELMIKDAVRAVLEKELRAVLADLKPAPTGALLTVREAAELARVSCDSLRRWIAAGRLTARRAGRELRIERAALEAFLKAEVPEHHETPEEVVERLSRG